MNYRQLVNDLNIASLSIDLGNILLVEKVTTPPLHEVYDSTKSGIKDFGVLCNLRFNTRKKPFDRKYYLARSIPQYKKDRQLSIDSSWVVVIIVIGRP